MKKLKRMLKQPSTQRAIIVIVAMAGWKLAPEQVNAVLTVSGLILAGLEGFRDEDKPRVDG